ncbi:ABC transporter permease [Sphingomonas hengshuiensis]|uniref:Membrane protein n=1 Tax=Sphingomonas hengshuiensis TaxID=1609977 RepID=A0A7U5CVB5_9SPHN|nr:ABC transporter permease [Sphingomonas hengshuiensis]AJP74704.1 membrane protein [Sphingomonas hengshuiensis]
MRAAFRETLRAILADKAVMTLVFISVILYSFLYPQAYRGEVAARIPVIVVDLDHSAMSRALLIRANATRQVEITAQADSPAAALAALKRQQASVIVVIPDDFEKRILQGRQGVVRLFGNGAYLLRSSTALAGVAAAFATVGVDAATSQAMAQGAPAASPIAVASRPLFNLGEGYGSSSIPAVAQIVVHQTLLMGLVMLAATRRERLGRLAFRPSALAGVAAAFLLIGLVNILYFEGFAFWLQGYPRAGTLASLLGAAALFSAAIVALALFLASFFTVRERAVQLWISTSLPIFFLAGISWPAEAMPRPLAWLALLLPTTPGINLMIEVGQMGATLSETWRQVANLLVITVAYGALAVIRLRPRPADETPDAGNAAAAI